MSSPQLAGPRGAPWPVLLVMAAFITAALAPLREMDLGQHLANGEWIWRHHAVPFTEPFAWTRAGQPYYAYSWLAEVLWYGLLRAFGPLALHLAEGVTVAAAAAATLWMGGRFGWSRGVRLTIAVLHLVLLWGASGTIRPQQALLITVPLAWGITAGIHTAGLSAGRLAALAAAGALAANTHLFFPLTAIPVAYWLITDWPRARPWLLAGVALALGWLLSPYGLSWPRVFALNFGHNILLAHPPSIAELMPGLEYAWRRPGVMISGAALLVVPWLARGQGSGRRELAVQAGYWTAGLLLFAFAGRLVLVWWLLALPATARAAENALQRCGRLQRGFAQLLALALAASVLVMAAPAPQPHAWRFEGGTVDRMLPRAAEDAVLWLPSWLLCHTRSGARGRVFTEFNYGSELNWRLPGYSPSIDGRTIFPDSIAADFSLRSGGRAPRHATTWQYADLALLDRSFWLAPVLDRDPGWLLLARSRPGKRGAGALWAKRAWWQRWGTASELPALDVGIGDPRGRC